MYRKFSTDDKELVKKTVAEVITRIEEIESDTVGMIAAQDIIDIVTQNLGPEIYNKGVQDAKKLAENKVADFSTEVDLLTHS